MTAEPRPGSGTPDADDGHTINVGPVTVADPGSGTPDPTPNGQTWACVVPMSVRFRTCTEAKAHASCRTYNEEQRRPVPPAPSSDTPSDERCSRCNGSGREMSAEIQIGAPSCLACFGSGKKENLAMLSNECSDPNPNGGASCCRPLGHHVLTDHWNGEDEWPEQPAPSPVPEASERPDTAEMRDAARVFYASQGEHCANLLNAAADWIDAHPAPSSSPVGDRGLDVTTLPEWDALREAFFTLPRSELRPNLERAERIANAAKALIKAADHHG